MTVSFEGSDYEEAWSDARVGGLIANQGSISRIKGIDGAYMQNGKAVFFGGAIANEGTVSEISEYSTIKSNQVINFGGALSNETGHFRTHLAGYDMGPYDVSSSATFSKIDKNVFEGNSANAGGGAIANVHGGTYKDVSSAEKTKATIESITGNTFTENTTGLFGGAIANISGKVINRPVTGDGGYGEAEGQNLLAVADSDPIEQGAIIKEIVRDDTDTPNTFTKNTASVGGAIANVAGANTDLWTLSIPNSMDDDDVSPVYDYGAADYGSVINKISGNTFSENEANGNATNKAFGGAIANIGNTLDPGQETPREWNPTPAGDILNVKHGAIIGEISGNTFNENTSGTASVEGFGGAIANAGEIFNSKTTKTLTLGETPEASVYRYAVIDKISGNTFTENNASKAGGGIANYSREAGGSTPDSRETDPAYYPAIIGEISKNEFTGNSAGISDSDQPGYGGAIYNDGLIESIKDNEFTSNSARNAGGAIFNDVNGHITSMSGNTFTSNTVILDAEQRRQGGSIANAGTIVAMTGNHFVFDEEYEIDWRLNDAETGGFIYNGYSTGNIDLIDGDLGEEKKAVMKDGAAAFFGGAIANEKDIGTIKNYTFDGNYSFSHGGAISNESGVFNADFSGEAEPIVLELKDSARIEKIEKNDFNKNVAVFDGGAIANIHGGTYVDEPGTKVTIDKISENNFTQNTADRFGGAIVNTSGKVTERQLPSGGENEPSSSGPKGDGEHHVWEDTKDDFLSVNRLSAASLQEQTEPSASLESGAVIKEIGSGNHFYRNTASAGGAIANVGGGKTDVQEAFPVAVDGETPLYDFSNIAYGSVIDKIYGNTFEENVANGDATNAAFGGAIVNIGNTYDPGQGEAKEWDPDPSGGTLSVTHGAVIGEISGNTFINNVSGQDAEDVYVDGYGGAIANIGEVYNSKMPTSVLADGSPEDEIYRYAVIDKISDNTFSGNSATAGGGAIANLPRETDDLSVADPSETDPAYYAGIIGEISGNTFSGNTAYVKGGAVFNASLIDKIKDNTFTENDAEDGGAIFNEGRINTVTGNTFERNAAGSAAGAIFNKGIIGSITDNAFDGNESSVSGGAIENQGRIGSINGNTFTGNAGGFMGGAISNYGAPRDRVYIGEIRGNTFTGNSVATVFEEEVIPSVGGAIINTFGDIGDRETGEGGIVGNTFTGNKAYQGGAIFNDAYISDIRDNTFSGNTAVEAGGAIYNLAEYTYAAADAVAGTLYFTGENTFFDNKAGGQYNDIHNDGVMTLGAKQAGDSLVTDANSHMRIGSGITGEGEMNLVAGQLTVDGRLTNEADPPAITVKQRIINIGSGTTTNVALTETNRVKEVDRASHYNDVAAYVGKDMAVFQASDTMTIDEGASLMITAAKGNSTYVIAKAEGEMVNKDTGSKGWSGQFLSSSVLEDVVRVAEDDANKYVIISTKAKTPEEIKTELPHVNPSNNLIETSTKKDTESLDPGTKFLSRASDYTYMPGGKEQMQRTINSSAGLATAGGAKVFTHSGSGMFNRAIEEHLTLSRTLQQANGVSLHQDGHTDLWVDVLGLHQTNHGMSENFADYGLRMDMGGIVAGADRSLSENSHLGIAGMVGTGSASSRGADFNHTKNDVDFWGLSLYGGWDKDNWNFTGNIGYTHFTHDIKQHLPGTLGMGSKLEADVKSHLWTAGVKAEYRFKASETVDIMPHVGLRYDRLHTGAFRTKSAFGDVLSTKKDTQDIFSLPVGIGIQGNYLTSGGWTVKPQGDLQVIFATGDNDGDTTVNYSGLYSADTMHTRVVDRTAGNVALGLDMQKGNMSFGIRYDGLFSSQTTSHGFMGRMVYKFK